MNKIKDLNIKIFADGAGLDSFLKLNSLEHIKGFTTNPSLMRKNGVQNYKDFSLNLLSKIKDKPISFEVFADEILEMEKQANEIASWGSNIFVKIPITNTKGESTKDLIRKLLNKKISCNVTAIFTFEQVKEIADIVECDTPIILSIFAGRIADTGVDPVPLMREIVKYSKSKTNIEILWASTREVLNIFQADECGCQIITVPTEMLDKMKYIGKDLSQFSKETVQTFFNDANSSKYKIT